jgi:hypothetical protein
VDFHLVQINVARAVAPIEGPELAAFRDLLDPVNALADRSPGFVWRLQTEDGDATSIRAFDSDLIIVNMSVWESLDALWSFVYDGMHLEVMRRRREWFERFGSAWLALWWMPADAPPPTVDEAKARLEHLDAHGPTAHAFTFKQRFAPEPAVAA